MQSFRFKVARDSLLTLDLKRIPEIISHVDIIAHIVAICQKNNDDCGDCCSAASGNASADDKNGLIVPLYR